MATTKSRSSSASRSTARSSSARSSSSRASSGKASAGKASGEKGASSRSAKPKAAAAATGKTAARRASGGAAGNRSSSKSSASSQTTTDHEQIRQWAEARGGKPSCVRGTGGKGDVGLLRIDFPGFAGEGKLQEVGWDEFFEKFDEQGLALLYQETTAGGEPSNFNKLVSRETAAGKAKATTKGKSASGKPAPTRGKTTAARGKQAASGAAHPGRGNR
jgi:hypothetical protein